MGQYALSSPGPHTPSQATIQPYANSFYVNWHAMRIFDLWIWPLLLQDVLSSLGSPNKLFYKAEDKVSVVEGITSSRPSLWLPTLTDANSLSTASQTPSFQMLWLLLQLLHSGGGKFRREWMQTNGAQASFIPIGYTVWCHLSQGQEVCASYESARSLQLQHVSTRGFM